jgi:antitoxin HicB
MAKTLDEYLALPYTIELKKGPVSGWFANVKELPYCMSRGSYPEEALQNISQAMRDWIAFALQCGETIPEPNTDSQFSGKFIVRIPKSLHRQLSEESEREGVSLNAFVSAALARAVGELQADAKKKKKKTSGGSGMVEKPDPGQEL